MLYTFRFTHPLSIICLFFIFILLSTRITAQNLPAPEITISQKHNDDGEPTFYAHNHTVIPYTVRVEFSRLRNTTSPKPNPFIKTVNPGRTHLVKLRKNFSKEGTIRYHYKHSFNMGCKDTHPNTEIEYLLPVADGDTIRTFDIEDTGDIVEQTSVELSNLGFAVLEKDTIYAARRGTVGRLVDGFESSEMDKYFADGQNYLQMIHEDCTFGVYRNLEKGSFLVEAGDEVDAGTPLAVVASGGASQEYRFRFLVMYRNPDYKEGEDMDYWKIHIPQFRTASGKRVNLQANETYVAKHARDVIFQEMNWREKWRWKRRN